MDEELLENILTGPPKFNEWNEHLKHSNFVDVITNIQDKIIKSIYEIHERQVQKIISKLPISRSIEYELPEINIVSENRNFFKKQVIIKSVYYKGSYIESSIVDVIFNTKDNRGHITLKGSIDKI